jgi:hypothetical protein
MLDNVCELAHDACPLTQPCAGNHLALSYRDVADVDLNPICAILKGDISVIGILRAHCDFSSGSGSGALEHIARAGIASLDLSGNRITDAGLIIIAGCLNHSRVRFIVLKFNPCQAVPLLTSDDAWSRMSRKASALVKHPPLSPHHAQQNRESQAGSCDRPVRFITSLNMHQLHSNTIFTCGVIGGTTSSSSCCISSSSPGKSHRDAVSWKRFRSNSVHPE